MSPRAVSGAVLQVGGAAVFKADTNSFVHEPVPGMVAGMFDPAMVPLAEILPVTPRFPVTLFPLSGAGENPGESAGLQQLITDACNNHTDAGAPARRRPPGTK